MRNAAFLFLFAAALAACQSTRPFHGRVGDGSFVQWRDGVAVTADHVPGSGTPCPDGDDIRFFAHPGDAPTWRPPVDGELLTLAGWDGNRWISRQGRDYQRSPTYRVNRAQVGPGMSGGPVMGADGAMVGMIVGYTIDSGVYLPEPVIAACWRRLGGALPY